MIYDVAIIGAGPAGLTAGIFTCRAGLKTICVERLAVGGQTALSYSIANYPGVEELSGFEIAERMRVQAESFGLNIVYSIVLKIKKNKSNLTLVTTNGNVLEKKVIIASGCKPRRLGLSREDEFIGHGISYCASCDGGFYRDKIVAVAGGGDSAMEYAVYLSRLAKKVYVLNRSEHFRANPQSVENVRKIKNVKMLTNTKVIELNGEDSLNSIEIDSNGQKKVLNIDGLFVAIGQVPDVDYLGGQIKLDKNGYILVDSEMRTSMKNVYACGDVTSKRFRQVITACSDGAVAGNSCIGD